MVLIVQHRPGRVVETGVTLVSHTSLQGLSAKCGRGGSAAQLFGYYVYFREAR